MDVSAVVCVHRLGRLGAAEEATQSLLGQSYRPRQVLVVADRVDGLWSALERRLPRGVRLLENRWGHGLSHARNTGTSASSGDLVAFLDDDAVAAPDWLERLVVQFHDPWVAAAGGRALPDWLGPGVRPWWLPEEIDWAVGCTFKGFANGRRSVRNVLGSNMCFRRDALERVGGFDPRLGGPISGDDTEVCLKLLAADDRFRIVQVPEAVVYHKVPPQRQTLRYILRSSWDQGAGKATVRRLHPRHSQALASEAEYLRYLAWRFLPAELRRLLRGEWDAAGHILTTLLSVCAVGYGYASTRLGDQLRAFRQRRAQDSTRQEFIGIRHRRGGGMRGMKTLLVTGGSGLLGNAIVRRAAGGWKTYYTYLRHPWHNDGALPLKLDVTDREAVIRCIESARPDLVIHSAGLRSLDYCEDHPDEARLVNTLGTKHVAEAAARLRVPMAFVSTDAVFDGERGLYRETDCPNPVIAYGRSKWQAESAMRELLDEDLRLIVRTSTIYGRSLYGQSLVEWIVAQLRAGRPIPMITDSYFSPVLSEELAAAILYLAERGQRGVFHVAGPDRCSRHELAKAVSEVFALDGALVEPVRLDEARGQFSARRLKDSSLDVSRAQACISVPLSGLEEGLAQLRDAMAMRPSPAAAG